LQLPSVPDVQQFVVRQLPSEQEASLLQLVPSPVLAAQVPPVT
jgi:hypothetical protein